MSGIHLSHLIPWDDLLHYLKVYKDPGIQLPVGACGRIHLDRKKVELQLKNREYLTKDICEESNCPTTNSKTFRKSDKYKLTLSERSTHADPDDEKKMNHFISRFANAIREFAVTERNKVPGIRNPSSSADSNEIINQLKSENLWLSPDEDWRSGYCKCSLVTRLIETGDAPRLLSLSNEEIQSVLGCQHGGQAVGNNIRFLSYHVFQVYLSTNLILAAGLENSPEAWGQMRPESYGRNEFMHDCDGQTFLHLSRKFLTEDVYMKDFDAMRLLSKHCFQFFYFLEMLRMEVGGETRTVENLKEDIRDYVYYLIRVR